MLSALKELFLLPIKFIAILLKLLGRTIVLILGLACFGFGVVLCMSGILIIFGAPLCLLGFLMVLKAAK